MAWGGGGLYTFMLGKVIFICWLKVLFSFAVVQVLPPLKDVKERPEIGCTVRNKLVRLMTHIDMAVKQGAAEFLFVLCKESGENSACLIFLKGIFVGIGLNFHCLTKYNNLILNKLINNCFCTSFSLVDHQWIIWWSTLVMAMLRDCWWHGGCWPEAEERHSTRLMKTRTQRSTSQPNHCKCPYMYAYLLFLFS